MITHGLPELVRLATEQAASAGFTMSCDQDTGRLLAALAAGVPTGGRILELGTGTGVGTAWIAHGLDDRTDVEVLTVEIEPSTAGLAKVIHWPEWVHVIIGDAVDITRRSGTFDMIFADAQGGNGPGYTQPSQRFDPAPTSSSTTCSPPRSSTTTTHTRPPRSATSSTTTPTSSASRSLGQQG